MNIFKPFHWTVTSPLNLSSVVRMFRPQNKGLTSVWRRLRVWNNFLSHSCKINPALSKRVCSPKVNDSGPLDKIGGRRLICLVCACWLGNRSMSLKSRRHVISGYFHETIELISNWILCFCQPHRIISGRFSPSGCSPLYTDQNKSVKRCLFPVPRHEGMCSHGTLLLYSVT